MDRDLRASLVGACTAAALSALVGVIAGVGFFILLLRAIAGGLLIGAAVYGGIFLLKRSLPGLIDSEGAPVQNAALESLVTPDMGANVDIVLPGDAPEPFIAKTGNIGSGAEGLTGDSDAEGAEETVYIDEPGLLESEDGTFDAEAAIPIESSREGGKRQAVGFDELDVLPDLDGFSDSFTASEFASGGSAAERQDGRSQAAVSSSGVAVPRTAQGGLDSAALAQAVRTILKRDQKG